ETEILPDFESYQYIDHTEFNATDYHSFVATNPTATYVDGRYTWNSIDYYRNDFLRNYSYNYPGSYWEVTNSTTFTDLITYSESYMSFADVYTGILNFDFSTYFAYTIYNYSTAKTYEINGLSSMYSVDVYTYYQDSLIQTPFDYYNIPYLEDNYYGFEIVYYVDSMTGFLLEYYFLYYDYYYAYFNDYSTDLAMNVEYLYNDIYFSAENWTLSETNAAYTPIPDADLPYLLLNYGACDYQIVPSMDEVSIFFDVGDSSSLMMLEVYLNGIYYDGFSGLSNGYYEYAILTKDIPMDENGHLLMFVLYDQNNLDHNTTWYWWLDDIRHEFPVIEELSVIYNYELGTFATNEWKLKDDNPNFFEMKFDGIVVDSGIYYDYMHISHTLDGNITVPGDYVLSIYANDLSGHESFYDVIIHVYENFTLDSTAPEIDGSTGLIKINVGENKELKWVLFDINLCCYEIWINDTFVEQQDAWDQTIEVYYELSTLDLGVWNITIIVHDTYDNTAIAEVIVIVEEASTEPTEPSNTITLDAPQVLYTALGIISLLALTYTIRKRR
ncbi:MAG: hypothetical protein H7641_03025, partial [Candidatus Heimdallarchaeota archaeon]|nr:hypothetical protein [Candidatus Heimdallarchaeota archaeon]MCK4876537.1 hypothetical protein [Candidatus Heimdallarchaeota archaeon]